jgi:hypothetical protein
MPNAAWKTVGTVDVDRVLTPLARLLRQVHARDVELGALAIDFARTCADEGLLLRLLAAAGERLEVLEARLAGCNCPQATRTQ